MYEPVGKDDQYFPTVIYDAMALGYDHTEGGELLWPSMQSALAQDGRDGLLSYPISGNRRSIDGTPFTGAVIQYAGDGIADPHYIYRQLDSVKHQYRCFFASAAQRGLPTLSAPATEDAPCP